MKLFCYLRTKCKRRIAEYDYWPSGYSSIREKVSKRKGGICLGFGLCSSPDREDAGRGVADE